ECWGAEFYNDPARCEVLLSKQYPQQKQQIALLVGAVREQICEKLLQFSNKPPAAVLEKLTAHLSQRLEVKPAQARWAVAVWAYAIRSPLSKHFCFSVICPSCQTQSKI